MWVIPFTASAGSVTMFLHLSYSIQMTPSLWFTPWWELKWRNWSVCVLNFPVHLYLHTSVLLAGDECNEEKNATLDFWLICKCDAPCVFQVDQVFYQLISFLPFHHLKRVIDVSFPDLQLNAGRSIANGGLF